jgi:signal transduction histidine kinase
VREAVQIVNVVNLVVFTVLGLIALRLWRLRRDRSAAWAAASFLTLGAVVLLGRALPEHSQLLVVRILFRADIVVLLLFPYCLYRFTSAFDPPSRGLTRLVSTMTGVLVIWTVTLPRLPQSGESRPGWFTAYIVAFLIHWTALTVIVAWRLWRGGRGQPTVARRRMQLLAFAAGTITVAIVLVAATTDVHSWVAFAGAVLAGVSGVCFALGLAPPRIVRISWRTPEQERMQDAIGSLMQLATSQQEVAARVLAPMAAIVGASGVVIRNEAGEILGSHNVPESVVRELERGRQPGSVNGEAEVVEIEVAGGSLLLWTTPYAPFFGDEELRLLRTLGALTGLALDRVRLFSQEREAKLALEHADELKSNFIALAAHELRTPVASVHGFAQTLTRLRGQLQTAQQIQLEDTLARETEKLATLVNQLLDLSRLDADVIPIEPQSLPVRKRVEAVIATAAGDRADEIEVRIDAGLEAIADAAAFDRVLTNLITNALRYGEAPILVRATCADSVFRISVEDRGPGVPPEFVPNLFERFTRSDASREWASGSGLGLAIARSYALAQQGELIYEPSEPHGARFQLVLAQPA